MRKLSLTYEEALSLARQSRPLITPNSGFEKQLLVWQECEYDVFTDEGAEKDEYREWKRGRDDIFKGGEEAVNKARASSMAKTVAIFGNRRMLKKSLE